MKFQNCILINFETDARTDARTLARTHGRTSQKQFSKVGDIKLTELIKQTFNRDGSLYLAYDDKNAFFYF